MSRLLREASCSSGLELRIPAGFSTRDMATLRANLERHGCRFATRGPVRATERDGLWVHPSALCGLLLGVSRTTVGWEWSGQPARVARP